MNFYQQKNIELYDFLNDNFKIKNARRWSDISQCVSIAKISATYKFFSELFPLNVDYSSKLESNSNSFKSIHYNILNPNKIINEVVRYSLYSDEIVIFHPLQNPVITNPEINPIKNPIYWMQNFMDSLYFYIVLQKWVRAGIVRLIINPCNYDTKLRDELESKAKKRVESFFSNPEYEKITKDESTEIMAEMFAQEFKSRSANEIMQELLNLSNPKFSEKEADEFSKIIHSKLKFVNPLYSNFNIKSRQISVIKTGCGANLESILHIANLTNGSIYTTNKSNWYQISQLDNVDYWTKVSHLYSKIEIPFLNNVETSFALNLREENRLSGIRTELRKIYNSVNTLRPSELNERKMRELNEGFMEEIRKSDAEWTYIKNSAKNKRYYLLASTVGIPIIFNQLSLLPLLLGSSCWLAKNISDEKLSLKKFRDTNPLSVYIDMQRKEPYFYSILKNCVI